MAVQQQDQFSFNSPEAQGSAPPTASAFGTPSTASPGLSFDTSPPQTTTPSPSPTYSFDPGTPAVTAGAASSPWLSSTPGSAPSAAPGPSSDPHAAILQQLSSTSDPTQRAVLQDQLARGVASSLQSAGHDVKWQGDQLIVDGRPYVVGDGSAMQTTGSTTESATVEQPGAAAAAQGVAANLGPALSNQDQFIALMNSGKYTNPQDAINAWNAMGLAADSSGLSSNYGSSPAYYGNNNTIGLPGGYLVQGGDGKWSFVQRSPETDGGGGGLSGDPTALASSIINATGSPNTHFAMPSYAAPNVGAGWQPGTGPTYAPGTPAPEDLSGLSYANLKGSMPTTDPTTAGGAARAQTDALMSGILQHPESMDPETVARMKAASKDELADMEKQQEQDITEQGFLTGNQDSNFVAAQKLAARGARDTGLISANRNIDIQAAEQNQKDRLAAAQLGATYSQQNIDNAFKSDAERMQATQIAADESLKAAATSDNRYAIVEAAKQKAAELGQSADSIMSQFILGNLSAANQRYGIDVGAAIDRAKLDQQSLEFKANLAYEIMALQQQDAQFGANLGLSYAGLGERANEFAQTQYDNTTNAG